MVNFLSPVCWINLLFSLLDCDFSFIIYFLFLSILDEGWFHDYSLLQRHSKCLSAMRWGRGQNVNQHTASFNEKVLRHGQSNSNVCWGAELMHMLNISSLSCPRLWENFPDQPLVCGPLRAALVYLILLTSVLVLVQASQICCNFSYVSLPGTVVTLCCQSIWGKGRPIGVWESSGKKDVFLGPRWLLCPGIPVLLKNLLHS